MTDPHIPVTEDELHAYVDNELPAERRSDVEAWLASYPDDAARVQSWRAMAEALHARYDSLDAHRLYVVEVRHPVEVPGNERAHLQAWLTKRCGWDVRAPELTASGLKLVGGRLLPGPTGPASFLMYESASGERFTIYTAKAAAETTQMRYATQDHDGALFWADRGVGYVVSGGTDRERLTQVAKLVYDQTEKSGG